MGAEQSQEQSRTKRTEIANFDFRAEAKRKRLGRHNSWLFEQQILNNICYVESGRKSFNFFEESLDIGLDVVMKMDKDKGGSIIWEY